MAQPIFSLAIALLAVFLVAIMASLYLPILGLTSAALLLLLPVLFAAVRGGRFAGTVCALVSALAFNFFLLPPRFTFHIHGVANLVSAIVFLVVAWVTSHLAMALKLREGEARTRADHAAQSAELSAILAEHENGIENGMAFLEAIYGPIQILEEAPKLDASFSSLDVSAGAWARHNGDMTGYGSDIMGASEWSFFPFGPKNQAGSPLVAIAKPIDGQSRDRGQMAHLWDMSRQLGQALDRRALTNERRMRERLADTDHLRRTILASLGHDFRTPLTVLDGQLSQLAPAHPEAHEALVAARRLGQMMDNLLNAARLDDGKLRLKPEPIDIVDVIAQVLSPLVVPHHLSITRQLAPDLPFVMTDGAGLTQILSNIVHNGLLHARTSLSIRAYQKGDHIVVAIGDDGDGIEEGQQLAIFDRFVRLSGNDRQGGSGLGLSIVKGFADALSIKISVSDIAPNGTLFECCVPVAKLGARQDGKSG